MVYNTNIKNEIANGTQFSDKATASDSRYRFPALEPSGLS